MECKLWEIAADGYPRCLEEVRKLVQESKGKLGEAAVNRIPDFVFKGEREMEAQL